MVREAVGVELLADDGVLGGLLLVLVQHPFQGAAVAQLVVPGFLGDALQ